MNLCQDCGCFFVKEKSTAQKKTVFCSAACEAANEELQYHHKIAGDFVVVFAFLIFDEPSQLFKTSAVAEMHRAKLVEAGAKCGRIAKLELPRR